MADQQSAEAVRTLPDHDQCDTHLGYKLSCEQYERLLARSGQLCEICRKSALRTHTGKLNIDHSGPWWAVRGLLCTRCNTELRNGARWLTGAAEYLAETWWLQECRRLGLPTAPGDEPAAGSAIRDQYGTVWIRYADGLWHPHGGRTNGATASWKRLHQMRGPQNVVPFDLYSPEGFPRLQRISERARLAAKDKDRSDYVEFLLDMFTRADLDEAAERITEDEDQPLPGYEREALLERAIVLMTCDFGWLMGSVKLLLESLPEGVGDRAMREARAHLYEEFGLRFTKGQFYDRAVCNVVDIYEPGRLPF